MIDIHINIQEKEAPDGKIAGRVEAKVYSVKPSAEEISVAARIMERVREIADEISKKPGAEVGIWEKKKRPDPGGPDLGTEKEK